MFQQYIRYLGGGATQNNTAEDYSNSQTWDWFFRFIGFLSVSSGCNPPYLYSIALYTLEEKPRTSLFHTFFELRLRLFLDRKQVCRDHSTVHVILLKLWLYGNYLFFNSEAYLSSITHGAIERYICMQAMLRSEISTFKSTKHSNQQKLRVIHYKALLTAISCH